MILFPQGKPTAPESFEQYLAGGGYESLRRNLSSSEILNEISASGLRGRGGARFPVGRKWGIAAETLASHRYVICNGGEDEPGSFKDRILLEYRPHLVLEGTLLAARAIDATEAFFYINEKYPLAIGRIKEAIAQAHPGIPVHVRSAPAVYVAGEDSACLEVLEGRDALPRQKPPFPAVVGLFGKPTVVNNVETLANIPQIVSKGAAWFRTFGAPESPGTMIFCVGDEVMNPGAYELPLGTSLRHLWEEVGGLRSGRPLKAILPGGPSSAFLTDAALDVKLLPETMNAAGSSLGCGAMRFFGEGTCMVEETLAITDFFSRESCGQCPACRMETTMLAAMMKKIRAGEGDSSLCEQIPKIVEFNKGKGYCALVNMPGPPLLSALRLFPEDFAHHLAHGTCHTPPV